MGIVSRLEPSQFGKVIILNGTSSAGKTSIAQAMQRQLATPCQHLQLDAFRGMEPKGYWDHWETQDKHVTGLKIAALCRAMNAAVSEYSRHGINIIFDTVMSTSNDFQYVLEGLAELPVFVIGITCNIDELSRREETRGDRKPGTAARQYDCVHKNKEYDFQVDTSFLSADECASRIVQWLSQQPVPRAFLAMQSVRMVE